MTETPTTPDPAPDAVPQRPAGVRPARAEDTPREGRSGGGAGVVLALAGAGCLLLLLGAGAVVLFGARSVATRSEVARLEAERAMAEALAAQRAVERAMESDVLARIAELEALSGGSPGGYELAAEDLGPIVLTQGSAAPLRIPPERLGEANGYLAGIPARWVALEGPRTHMGWGEDGQLSVVVEPLGPDARSLETEIANRLGQLAGPGAQGTSLAREILSAAPWTRDAGDFLMLDIRRVGETFEIERALVSETGTRTVEHSSHTGPAPPTDIVRFWRAAQDLPRHPRESTDSE